MGEINNLDMKTFVTNAVTEVFDTMLSLEVEPFDDDRPKTADGNRIVGSVSFAGGVMGSINIQVANTFAWLMTGAMLGMELEEVEEEEVRDVLGEVSNMVGGNLKSRLCDSGLPCELSIPSIVTGQDFKIESKHWARHECFAFRHAEHVALVEVFIKSSN